VSEPQVLHPDHVRCPTCFRPWPVEADTYRRLTSRELDAISGWWEYRSVKLTARLLGVGEQRAKNLLASARVKAGVGSNGELAAMYLGQLRSIESLIAQHNGARRER
jgi:DNA-binding CsgD family transcriptional regulator